MYPRSPRVCDVDQSRVAGFKNMYIFTLLDVFRLLTIVPIYKPRAMK